MPILQKILLFEGRFLDEMFLDEMVKELEEVFGDKLEMINDSGSDDKDDDDAGDLADPFVEEANFYQYE